VRSVVETFRRRQWKVRTSRSPKSRSRYVLATKGNRTVTVRVSDHRNPGAKADLDYDFRRYEQRRLASFLDRKKYGRTRKRKRK